MILLRKKVVLSKTLFIALSKISNYFLFNPLYNKIDEFEPNHVSNININKNAL